MKRITKREIINTRHGTIIAEPLPKAQPNAKTSLKRLNVEMADRHLRAIEKWVKAGHITEAQAATLRTETITRVTG
jgi:hypothetical protein